MTACGKGVPKYLYLSLAVDKRLFALKGYPETCVGLEYVLEECVGLCFKKCFRAWFISFFVASSCFSVCCGGAWGHVLGYVSEWPNVPLVQNQLLKS